ncbi:fungal-specific transcription factor domain-containing protein [Dactylonectria macrodidyma]|uniref:Fungal-specific transcription factor domain-containing protein n=1 Tax=Dactylonectria macrodidyma TaxID=307937 RepID=A0A9P9DML0_9HYPO|nr:fungal-specific transcription factor domain-containing protein [Dactylonectria macrodidyma]
MASRSNSVDTQANSPSGGGTARKSKRACVDCNRKKTKCDMTLPSCHLCIRTNTPCLYPSRRKKRTLKPRRLQRQTTLQKDDTHDFEHVPDRIPAPNQGHDSSKLGFWPIDDTNSQDCILPLDLDAELNDLGNTHPALLETASLGGQYSNQANSVNSFMDLEPRPEIPEESQPGSALDSLALSWDSQCFWLTDSHTIAPQTDGPCQESPANGRATGSSILSVHTVSAADATISGALLEELVTLYFGKVHCFVPILHRPRFYEQYFSGKSSISDDDAAGLLRDSLVLNGMLALAARFSSSPYFKNIPNTDKGERFAESAKEIYYECLRGGQKSTLEFLQGCTLLAFQLYLHGPSTEGWLVIGTCTRLANELGLNAIDLQIERDLFSPVSLEWSKKEELRRAWWSVWELDTFSAAVACRPHTIDRMTMHVKLPVSDENWFANMFVESAIVDPDPVHTWHTLRDCPNQDERAWFLLINYILLTAHDLGQRRSLQRKEIEDIDTAISCYTLLLPSQFHLLEHLSPASLRPTRVSSFNWIIATNIMLQGCRVFVKLLNEGASTPRFWSSSRNLLTPLAAESQFGASEAKYRVYTDRIIRIIRLWPPEYIPSASPFIGCLVLGPAAMHLRVAMGCRQAARDQSTAASLEEELLKLALSHMAQFWRLGALLLDFANSITPSRRSVSPQPTTDR